MLEKIKSKHLVKILFKKYLEIKVKLKIIAYNKSLQSLCSVNIEDYKQNAIEYRIKDKNGKYEIRSATNNFLKYEGGLLNGKENGFGKEYGLIRLELDEFIKQNKNKIKGADMKIFQENNKNIYFPNYTFIENSEETFNKDGNKFILHNYLQYEGEFLNGQKHGKGKEYYLKNLIFEGEYKHGKRWNGKAKEYGIWGNLMFEGLYINGVKIGKEFDFKGNLIFEGIFLGIQKFKGKGKKYNHEGKLIFEGEYSNYKKGDKRGKEFDDKGNLLFEGEYKNGKRWKGKVKAYDFFGSLILEGEYINGEKKTGILKLYKGQTGKLLFEIKFNNGEGYGKEYDKNNGNILFEGKYINVFIDEENIFYDRKALLKERWNGKEKKYNDNGYLIFEGEYINGVRYGKEYDIKGNIIFEGEYSKMKRFKGIGKVFDKNGNLKYEDEYILGNKKRRMLNENGKIILTDIYPDTKISKGRIKDSKADNNEESYKGKEYDNGKLILEGEFSFEKRIKGKRKIYDINNNYLFEFDYDKNSTLNKKEILLQIKTKNKGKKGIIIEKGKEINLKNNTIFEGEFLNEKKLNGIIKLYNNLNINEDREKKDSKIEEEKGNNSRILLLEDEIENGIWKRKIYCNDELILESEYKNGEIWKEKYFCDNKLISESEYRNGELWKTRNYYDNILTSEREYRKGEIWKGKEYDFLNGNIVFEGEYKNKKRWEGKGIEYYGKSLKFEGEYKNGEIWKGKEYDSYNANTIYEGEFINGKRHGKGKEYYFDKIIYEGEYKNGEICKGKEYGHFNGKLLYEGEFKNGKRNGKGKEIDINGNIVFIGEYQSGKRNGKGIAFDNKKRIIFEGEYIKEKKWDGIEYYYKGKYKFEQKYKNGERIGKIIMKEYYKNNLNFEGESLNWEKSGHGKEYYKNKLIFEGEYLNGKKNGFGIEYNFDGGKFIGEFKDDRKWEGTGYKENGNLDYEIIDGFGYGKIKEYYNGKLIYAGQYLNGKRHGKGTEYDFLTRTIKYEGRFAYGKKLI